MARTIQDVIPGRHAVALRYMAHVQRSWWISSVPEYRNGKQYGDFGYSENTVDAKPLSEYWQRRIRRQVSDCSQHDGIQFLAVDNVPRRASGDCVCSCGKKYYDHPMDTTEISAIDGKPFLHVLCDKSRVKL